MKIEEVKNHLANHSPEKLKLAIIEIYRAIPKSIKESKEIDSIIINPDKFVQGRKGAKKPQAPDIELLRIDAEAFIEFARNELYFIPNQFVSKKERSQWRFIVKRLYKELSLSSQVESNLSPAVELLEKLYNLLCYSCSYTIFNSYDSFESIGVEQTEFFNRVLFLKYQIEPKRAFISNALKLMMHNSLNRYTLYSNLIQVILSFCRSIDMLEMALEENSKLLQLEKASLNPKAKDKYSQYDIVTNINNLTEFGFLCYVKMFEMDNAITFFKQNYIESDKEISLYILLRLLFSLNHKEHFLREYEAAVKDGVKPRDELVKTYKFTKETGQLPEYFGWFGKKPAG